MQTATHQCVKNCPICDNLGSPLRRKLKIYVRAFDGIVASEFSVCAACDFAFMVNPFDDETMADYYRKNDQIRRDEMSAEEELHTSNQVRFLSENMGDRNIETMLEVGADNGAFLKIAQKKLGIRCYFDELNEVACSILSANGFLDANKMDAKDRRFDVIVVRHVLEHIVFPAHYLEELKKRMSPGGLVFVEVPDCTSIDMNETDTFCLEHVNYFSLASMCRLMNRAGYSIVAYESSRTEGYGTTSNRVLRILMEANPHSKNTCDQGSDAWDNLLNKALKYYDAIDSLFLKNKGKRTAFYGAGTHTLMFLANTSVGLPPVIYDKDPKKIGTELHGSKIVDAETITDSDADILIVMVTSYKKEVRAFLEQKGISKEKTYFLTQMA
ncbi:hypothetical protein A3H22_02890 [Candidatus Peribacteria bacterium RIFCSPLOWO2_12_FULL_55_15]|nr:MAG: hypothetical protein A2789_04275 [Candidatus Peribacteria bacterium RIFCSPHIGHO2_01_FULL_54_22]OGJ63292.1 MAG: hypothetical protein A3D12_03100 [Candidatus Peribacteria bacterium RIFCSPHIGHO2_02_FULL_55_24]OGJ67169.1 MAG: hypothetical protein A2947_00100 [Candidatus Peribacteria bacterium RIFCSPLOWO2_01_FULL_54_110]OGJ70603.1 MAG: hypothetical protein A3H22_02890 [Candidatus Peribacteria bacterium RIFCSPLOWO2_12_FULL_55_15]